MYKIEYTRAFLCASIRKMHFYLFKSHFSFLLMLEKKA